MRIVEWDNFNGVVSAVSGGVVVDNISAPVDEDFIAIGSGCTGDECWPRYWHSGFTGLGDLPLSFLLDLPEN